MHQLYLVEAGSVQDAREMFDSVLGKAVADKENPEISFSVPAPRRKWSDLV